MHTYTIIALIVACLGIAGFVLSTRQPKSKVDSRPAINIDFDTAKEREDKNRYFG